MKTRTLAAALALVATVPAAAQIERLTWIAGGTPEAPSLLFGIPDSDYAVIAFRCAADIDGVQVTYDREPAAPRAGASVPIDLSSDGGFYLIPATAVYSEMMGGYFLEGTAARDELMPILFNGMVLFVTVEDGTEELLMPDPNMLSAFFAACAPFA